MKKSSISNMIGLGLSVAIISTVEARIWSYKGKLEGDFVSLSDDKVKIKDSDGKIHVIELKHLIDADRKFALAQAKQGGEGFGPVKTKISAELQTWRGFDGEKETLDHVVEFKVLLTGGVAAEAFAMAPFQSEPLIMNGKELKKKRGFSLPGFTSIKRGEKHLFAKHPDDGIGFSALFSGAAKDTEKIDIKGSVKVVAGGKKKVCQLKNLAKYPLGAIKDAGLKAAGIKLNFSRHDMGDSFLIGVRMAPDIVGFVGLELVGADGKKVGWDANWSSYGATNKMEIDVNKKSLEGATLKVLYRHGAKVVSLPIEAKAINVEAKK